MLGLAKMVVGLLVFQGTEYVVMQILEKLSVTSYSVGRVDQRVAGNVQAGILFRFCCVLAFLLAKPGLKSQKCQETGFIIELHD